jgi:adenosine deaminase
MIPLDVLRKLPKAELHCHLDGSVRPQTIIDLAKEQGVALPTFDVNELRKLICVPLDCPSLEEYLRGFDITLLVLQKQYAIVRVFYEMCEDAVRDGVTYLEVRFSPILHTRHGMALSTVMEAVIEAQAAAELRLPIVVRIIVCGMRQMPSQVSLQLAQIAWRFKPGVVGFDLAGPELGFSSKQHREAYELIRSKNLNCTLHAG